MVKMTITESDINELAKRHTLAGERLLVGVYGSLDKFPQALGTGVAIGAIAGPALGGAIGGALSNKWSLFFANDQRTVIDVLGYTTAETKNVIQIPLQDIQQIKIKDGLIMRKIHLKLQDGKKIKFKAQKRFVFGHPHHKQRLEQLTQNLRNLSQSI